MTRIRDNISYSKGTGVNADKSYAANEDFKNHGIELSVTEKATDNLTWHAGITYQDPKTKVNSEKIGAKTYWDREYGRFMLNAGVSYEKIMENVSPCKLYGRPCSESIQCSLF